MSPTDDEKDDFLLSCRYGDIDDVHHFVDKYGQDILVSIRDENGNNILHMVAGNGHVDVLDYLLPIVPPSLLSAQNNSGSTALHWAAVNAQLEIAQKLIRCPGGPGNGLIDIKNSAGRSPLGEAEMAGWDEGAKYMVQVMNLDENGGDDDEPNVDGNETPDIEVEIQDAEGQISKIKITSQSLS